MHTVDEQIRRAMEAGQFDDLPGKGQPLTLNDDPHADPEWRLAFHILRNSGTSLPWIEAGREIDAGLERAQAALSRSWRWRQDALAAGVASSLLEQEWGRAVAVFRQQVEQLNRRIRDHNLAVPALAFQRRLVDVDRVLAALAGASADAAQTPVA